jgi:hypothetical protein
METLVQSGSEITDTLIKLAETHSCCDIKLFIGRREGEKLVNNLILV